MAQLKIRGVTSWNDPQALKTWTGTQWIDRIEYKWTGTQWDKVFGEDNDFIKLSGSGTVGRLGNGNMEMSQTSTGKTIAVYNRPYYIENGSEIKISWRGSTGRKAFLLLPQHNSINSSINYYTRTTESEGYSLFFYIAHTEIFTGSSGTYYFAFEAERVSEPSSVILSVSKIQVDEVYIFGG